MPTVEPHQYRRMAESFGTDAERYDRARPTYPQALINRIAAKEILDVGCGTGIEARQLQAAGCTVLGVEPDERMAAFARDTGVAVEVSTFEDWDPAGRTFDAVVAAQAWHWVNPAKGAAKAIEVLRPGGLFAAFWHMFLPPDEVQQAFAEAFQRAMPDSPIDLRALPPRTNPYQPMITSTGERFAEADGFGEPEHLRYAWDRTYTRDQWLDLLPTQGGLTRATPAQLAEILEGVGAAIDTMGGAFTHTFTTVGVAITRA
jgi:SAM-dependent methyltransferase